MVIRMAKHINPNLSEKEIQKVIESNIEKISDWELKYVASFLIIGPYQRK